MRVWFVPSWFPTKGDTFGAFCLEQAKAVSEDHDVGVVYCNPTRVRKISEMFRWPQVVIEKRGKVFVAVAEVGSRPGWAVVFLVSYLAGLFVATRELRKNVGKPDVLHGHAVMSGGFGAYVLAKVFRVPYVLTEHSSCISHELRGFVRSWIVRRVFRGAREVVAVGEKLREDLIRENLVREATLISNMVNLRTFVLKPEGTKNLKAIPKIIFVGHLSRQKGVYVLLEACRVLAQEGLAFSLNIVGEGLERPELERQVENSDLASRIQFHGMLPPMEVACQMRKADLFVLPSFKESFGVVVIEALAVGLPVVAAQSGGPEYFLTPELGRVVESGSVNALVQGIKDVMENIDRFPPKRLRSFVEERFSVHVIAAQINAVYQRALTPRRPR